jgi:sigma-B regulation protein RsbU (phosphoserine phosphatase)
MLVAPGVSRMLPVPKGPLVGAIPDARYAAMELTLQPGETFFCYTDGVTEAQDANQQEYTETRCLDFVNRQPLQDTAALLDAVRREVAAYTRTDVLEDDFTLFALRRL